MKPKFFSTDVLIIGGAGAGLRAAIEAAEVGANVLVVSKARAAGESSTLRTAGWLTYCPAEHSRELFRHAVQLGGFLNDQRLVEVYARDTSARVEELKGFGIKFEKPGSSFGARGGIPTGIRIAAGKKERRGVAFTVPLRKESERRGARILDRTVATDVIVVDGRARGAVVFDLSEGQPYVVSAKSCIIATGGGAGMFERQNNPPGTTGDGFGMAFRGGAELVDMELISFTYPQHGVEMILNLGSESNERLYSLGGAHYFLGGIKIDARTRTTVEGLFAAGEVTGGLFGAARHSGAAMADIIVFGAAAGEEAAKYAREQDAVAPADLPYRDKLTWVQRLLGDAGADPQSLTRKLRRVMWRDVGPVKRKESMESALDQLEVLREQAEDVRVATPLDVKRAVELRNMLDAARLVVTASLLREETRGNFWRVDYPRPDNAQWLKNICLRSEEGGVHTRIRPAVMTALKTPTEPLIGAGCFSYEQAEASA